MRNLIPPYAVRSGKPSNAQRKPCAKCQQIRDKAAVIAARIRAAIKG